MKYTSNDYWWQWPINASMNDCKHKSKCEHDHRPKQVKNKKQKDCFRLDRNEEKSDWIIRNCATHQFHNIYIFSFLFLPFHGCCRYCFNNQNFAFLRFLCLLFFDRCTQHQTHSRREWKKEWKILKPNIKIQQIHNFLFFAYHSLLHWVLCAVHSVVLSTIVCEICCSNTQILFLRSYCKSKCVCKGAAQRNKRTYNKKTKRTKAKDFLCFSVLFRFSCCFVVSIVFFFLFSPFS